MYFGIFIALIALSAAPVIISGVNVECIVDKEGNIEENCKFCGFINITTHPNNGTAYTDIVYQCLQEQELFGGGFETTTLNQCVTQVNTNYLHGNISSEMSLCNVDSCNKSCYSSAIRHSFNVVTVMTIILLSFWT